MSKKVFYSCLKAFFVGLVLLLLYAPILLLAVYSFDETNMIGRFKGFSFVHYVNLFTDPNVLSMIGNTLLVAAVAATLSTVLGTAGALGMFYCKKRVKTAIHAVSQIHVRGRQPVHPRDRALLLFAARRAHGDLHPLRRALGHAQAQADG